MAVSKGFERTWPARRPSIETMVLAAVCLLDLVSTVVLVSLGQATEANPMMAYFLEHSVAAFCAVKLLFVVPPLLVAEWYRRYNDRLVRATLRAVTVAYLVVYAVGVVAVNPHLL